MNNLSEILPEVMADKMQASFDNQERIRKEEMQKRIREALKTILGKILHASLYPQSKLLIELNDIPDYYSIDYYSTLADDGKKIVQDELTRRGFTVSPNKHTVTWNIDRSPK